MSGIFRKNHLERLLRVRFVALLLALLLLPAVPSYAGDKACTAQEATQASKTYGSVPREDWTWDKLYKSFRDYGHCANAENNGIWDAELAYAYDSAVQHLLLDDWDQFGKFVEIDRKDKRFRSFVLLYIDEDMSREEAAKIAKNAKQHCPPNAKSLCKAVETAANAPSPGPSWETERSW